MLKKKPADDLFEQSSMSFGDHLEELRKALMKAFIWLGIGTAIGLYFSESIVKYFQEPLEKAVYQFRVDQAKQEFKKANGADPTPELAELISRLGLMPEINYVDPLVFAMDSETPGSLLNNLPAAAPKKADSAESDKSSDRPKADGEPTAAATTSQKPVASQDRDEPSAGESAAGEPADESAADESAADSEADEESPAAETLGVDFAPAKSTLVSAMAMPDGELQDVVGDVMALPNAWQGVDRESLGRLRSFIIWKPIATNLVSLDATEGFMIFLKAGLLAGVLIGSPGIFWHIWQFFAAGLYPHERRYVYWYLPLSLLLFLAGFALAFYVIFKLVLGFLMLYTNNLGVEFTPRLTDYMTFALFLPLGFGIAFQLPLAMLGLHRFGVVPVELFVSQWRLAVLAIAFLSMILTPAEPYSMIGLAIPLTGLYFLGILLCKYMPKGAGLGSAALDPKN